MGWYLQPNPDRPVITAASRTRIYPSGVPGVPDDTLNNAECGLLSRRLIDSDPETEEVANNSDEAGPSAGSTRTNTRPCTPAAGHERFC